MSGPLPLALAEGHEWAQKRRALIAAIAEQAPHVYAAEMKVYSDGTFGASAIPNCVPRGRGGGPGGCGRLRGEELVDRLYLLNLY
ncbi:uncharacterized protein PG986_011456 [Apiospora aurea]|uniref:Uncharacterized protein n=1 Tax=Apiospora aurea TaxID=335848 RepID=A0ABR1Q576_9PEZI